LELVLIEEYRTHANQMKRPMIEDVSMIGVGSSLSPFLEGLLSVTVSTDVVVLSPLI
jgi:hypothetical protein